MDAKNKAFRASLEQTEARTAKVVAEQKRQSKEIPLTTFEGIDAESGRAKQITNLDCGGEAIAVGEIISGGSFKMGSPVMARGTEGSTRLDGKSSMALSLDCGSGGAPSPRIVNDIPDPDEEETENIEEGFRNQKSPPNCKAQEGRTVFGSTRYVGKAKIYDVYTGKTKRDDNGFFYCETEERIDENSDEIEEFPKEDTGCVSPEEAAGAAPLKRCQWFNATQIQALNFFGCPDGMTCTGFVEYPSGQYRILCCTLDDSPAPVQGIGAEWRPENVAETGSAAVDVDYCSSARASMTWGESGEAYSENPPVSFSVSGETVTISDGTGAIATVPLDEVLGEGVSQEAAPDTDYCDGKAKAVLTWDGGGRIETLNPPISYNITEQIKAGSEISFSSPITYSAKSFFTHTAPEEKVIVGIDDTGTSFAFGANPSIFPLLTKFVGGDVPRDLGLTEIVVNAYGGIAAVYDEWIAQYLAPLESITFFFDGEFIGTYSDNRGSISLNYEYRNKLTVYTLVISDATGEIASYESDTEPTGFGVTCYDYAIAYQCRNKPICS